MQVGALQTEIKRLRSALEGLRAEQTQQKIETDRLLAHAEALRAADDSSSFTSSVDGARRRPRRRHPVVRFVRGAAVLGLSGVAGYRVHNSGRGGQPVGDAPQASKGVSARPAKR